MSGNPVITLFTQTLVQFLDGIRFLAEDIPIVSPLIVGLVGSMIALKGALSLFKLVEFVTGMESLKTVMQGFGASETAITNVGRLGTALSKLAVVGAIAAAWKVGFDQINQTVEEHIDKISKSDDAYGSFIKTNKKLQEIVPGIKNDLKVTVNLFTDLAEKSPAAAQAVVDGMKKSGQATGNYEKILQETIDTLALQGIAEDDVSKKVQDARDKLAGKNNELDRYIDKLRATTDYLLDQSNAELNAEEALDRMTQSLIENGRNFDINTEAGRENIRARDGGIKAIAQEIDVLRANAEAGYLDIESKKALLAHLDELAASGYPGARAEANRLRREVEAIEPVYTAEVRLNIDKALAQVRLAGRAFALLGGVNITAYLENIVRENQGIEARAGGGRVLSNTAYLVGEKGPELFVPDSSGYVLPNVPRPSSSFSGSGQYAYPGDFETSGSGSHTTIQNFNAPLMDVEQHFGPGTGAADMIAAIQAVSRDEVAKALAQVMASLGAGAGANGGG